MDNPLFSIVIPTWNNLPFLKLCVESIEKHSTYKHQIIIHVNEGTDGTLDWVKNSGYDYTYTEKNAGVCVAMNMMRTKVKTDYICFVNDDMYALPEWDKVLYDEIKKIGTKYFFLSSSVFQPRRDPICGTGVLKDYGDNASNFREEDLLKEYKDYLINDWTGATAPPNIVHRDIWDYVGGYSIEFSPGMGSDPDFSCKLWQIGVRYFKGLGASRFYHFESKSVSKVKTNKCSVQFLFKWNLPISAARNNLIHLGGDWNDEKNRNMDIQKLQKQAKRGWLKGIWYAIKNQYGLAVKLWE